MAFGTGTRQWVRGTLTKIAASTTVLGSGELLLDENGGVYGGDGVTTIKNLIRLARLSDITTAIAAKADLVGGKVPLAQTDVAGIAASSALTTAFTSPAQVDARVQQVVGAAPAALDTLVEIATQLTADESAAAAIAGRLTTAETNIAANSAAIAAVYSGGVVA